MFKLAVVAVAAAVVVVASLVSARRPKWDQLEGYSFERFMDDFNKPYKFGTPDYKLRKHTFLTNLKKIRDHNKDLSHTWRMGVNQFTDMTPAEWKRFNGFKRSPYRDAPEYKAIHKVWEPATRDGLPFEIDWRSSLSDVKSQGSCGCCWACSATETLEFYHYQLTGMKAELSFDQVNTCTPAPISYGCDGGDYSGAWAWINATAHAISEEWPLGFRNFFFPTTGEHPTAPCLNLTAMIPKVYHSWFAYLTLVGVDGLVSIKPNDATALLKALAEIGPQSISVAAGNWQWYESGVMKNTDANGKANEWEIDHAVQLVGAGFDKELGEKDGYYWLVRNSWTTNWGDNGYIRLWRAPPGEQEPCGPAEFGPCCGTSGILCDAAHPIVKKLKPLHF